eukprot:scaffold181508_cov45-Tisochrysis_lutea.AAC.1
MARGERVEVRCSKVHRGQARTELTLTPSADGICVRVESIAVCLSGHAVLLGHPLGVWVMRDAHAVRAVVGDWLGHASRSDEDCREQA